VFRIPPWNTFFLSFVNATIGLYISLEQSVDTLFKLTIVKFLSFKVKSARKSLTAGAESSIFYSFEIPREVSQCSTKNSRFQSPTVNRVFRVAAGATSVDDKKGLKTAGRFRANSKGMGLLTPTVLFLLRWKFEGNSGAATGARSFRCLLMARGAETNHSLMAAFLHSPFVQT